MAKEGVEGEEDELCLAIPVKKKPPDRKRSLMPLQPQKPARDVHVSTSSDVISNFIDVDRRNMICFRCGESGHVRYQCLTYKVRLCWHHESGTCTESHCLFAHGKEELRTPWKQRCVRVVKHDGKFVCIGCNSTEHTFRKCPLHRDLLLL